MTESRIKELEELSKNPGLYPRDTFKALPGCLKEIKKLREALQSIIALDIQLADEEIIQKKLVPLKNMKFNTLAIVKIAKEALEEE